MKLRSVLHGVVLLTAGIFIGPSARAQSVNLNCIYGDSDKVLGHVTFDEGAGTAGFSSDVNNVPSSPAKFTDIEITWSKNSDFDGKAQYYTLNRTTGYLTKPGSPMTCTVAHGQF